jgi:predicted anti-sigma-YlaC factor YlaD
MQCVEYREALSARLDGEPLGVAAAEVDRHLRDCPGCASWYAAASRVTRLARVAPAPAVPDLTDRILAAGAAAGLLGPPRRRLGWARGPAGAGRLVAVLRAALAVVAIGQAAIGWPALALGADTMQAPMHVAHESGAWNVAVGVALLAVVRRPRYAAGLLPLLGAVVSALAVATVSDVAMGEVHPGRFVQHSFLLAALLLVAAINRLAPQSHTPPLGGRGQAEPAVPRADAGDADAAGLFGGAAQLPAVRDSRHRAVAGHRPGGDRRAEEVVA